ncbi:hypothetical protein [Dietzia lutea]|uniref:hypothetical protein n=1 Tax=Dietzia lutea TaxID=546160 RepID=UPI0013A59BC7|nr:hypothetical protein [Dietzia lutea]
MPLVGDDVGVVTLVCLELVADDVGSSAGVRDRVRALVRVGEAGGADEVVTTDVRAAVGVGVGAAGPGRSEGAQLVRCFCAIHAGTPLAIASAGQVPRWIDTSEARRHLPPEYATQYGSPDTALAMTAHPAWQSMIRAPLFGNSRSALITAESHSGPVTSSTPVTSGADDSGTSLDIRGDPGDVTAADGAVSTAACPNRDPPPRTRTTTPAPTTSTARAAVRTTIIVLEAVSSGRPVIARLLHGRSHTHL